ncbi:hypothetical protein E2C01_086528 [Portunus trituberculatus]|uniref:Uncharacterized protein n=1 Tax=Portunus trituberculatus TaxID=210409 RepID=A0A5B7JET8_PORTR|nr:hypothetical protein [Portunus trituberculatus]
MLCYDLHCFTSFNPLPDLTLHISRTCRQPFLTRAFTSSNTRHYKHHLQDPPGNISTALRDTCTGILTRIYNIKKVSHKGTEEATGACWGRSGRGGAR